MSPRIHQGTPRCPSCEMKPEICICAHFPKISPVLTRLVLIAHRRELLTTSNTGKMATSLVPGSYLHARGNVDDPPLSIERLETLGFSDHKSLLLFPGDESVELTPALAAEYTQGFTKPVLLIVPDGTWSQASKIRHREKALHGIPCVRLPKGPPSRYQLRINPHLEKISTFEAIARALEILEGPALGPLLRKEWETLFQIRIERTLWTRGLMKKTDLSVPLLSSGSI